MYKADALAHFGGLRSHLARALDPDWSASAVYLWKSVVPLAAAQKLAEITDGKLQVVPDLYDQHGNIASAEDKILPNKKRKRRKSSR